MLLLLFSYKVGLNLKWYSFLWFRQIKAKILLLIKVYKIILARKKPFHGNQASGLLNNFSVSGKDGEQKNSTVNEETDKERELKVNFFKFLK